MPQPLTPARAGRKADSGSGCRFFARKSACGNADLSRVALLPGSPFANLSAFAREDGR
ncbi:hypothetical protein ACVISU_001803 [Bradyrhizobium sp. USDA 4452]